MALRVHGIGEGALLELVRQLDTRLQVHADELDIRNAGPYVERAQAKFAAGFPAVEYIDDLWLASRCLHGHAELHFLKHAVEKVRTRRIEPLELAVLGGQTSVMLDIADQFGFPIMPVLAHTAPRETMNEAAHVSSFFSIERLEGLRDLVGLAAAIYSAAFASLIRGLFDEAELALDLLRDAARAAGATGAPDEPPALVRYLRLNRALRLLVRGDADALPPLLDDLVTAHLDTLATAAEADPKAWAQPTRAASFLDTSTASILALAILKGVRLDPSLLGPAAAAYAELYGTMLEVDRTEAEEARAAEAREKLEKAVTRLQEAGIVSVGPGGDGAPEPSATPAPPSDAPAAPEAAGAKADAD